MELYVNARLTSSQSIKAINPHKELSKTIPRGACFQFNSGKQCNSGLSCRFQHRCYNCGGSHPFIQCTKQVLRPFRVLPKFKYQSPQQIKCIDKIKFAKTQKSLTLTQLQSLIGLLNFACNVVLQSEHSIGD